METLLLVAFALLAIATFVRLLRAVAAKDRAEQELTALRRLLDTRLAQIQWLTARLRELLQLMDSLEGSATNRGGRLRLDEHGTLHEDDNAGSV